MDALVDRLTAAGLEVEEILRTGPDLSGVTIGLVLERRAHPDADRLSVCRVDVGGAEPLEIVCGAPNVAAGQKVAVATVGTQLPAGLRIKRSKIRGVDLERNDLLGARSSASARTPQGFSFSTPRRRSALRSRA